MRKVTTINLAGRAYQLEEPAYDKLQQYLHHAEAKLAKDPDKAEIITDIEQAIADKCERLLSGDKNVVSSEQVTEILNQMGAVETDDAAEETETPEAHPVKRLFVIREGAMLMGVCTGIGAYVGIEPNLIRLAFVLLTIFTGGLWIVIYLLLGLFLPTARTDAELAEAYGRPLTAQAIVARAKERAPDPETLRNVSDVLVKILRVIARIISLVAAAAFAAITAAWVWLLWLLGLGRLHFYDQLKGVNGWHAWLIAASLYVLAAVPVLLVARLFGRVANQRHQTRITAASEGSMAVLWGVALVTLIAFGTAYAQSTRDYVNSHNGWLKVGNSNLCVDGSRCDPHERTFFNYHEKSEPFYPAPPPKPVLQ